jgi:hypothetical protein
MPALAARCCWMSQPSVPSRMSLPPWAWWMATALTTHSWPRSPGSSRHPGGWPAAAGGRAPPRAGGCAPVIGGQGSYSSTPHMLTGSAKMCPRRRRRHRQAEEAVVLDMGLWEKQQQQSQQPTTPTSPSRLSLGGAACSALPGAMPLHNTAGGSLPGCLSATGSVPTSPGSNHGEQAAGVWGFWTAPASGSGGGAAGLHGQQCAVGGGGDDGSQQQQQLLRLYQILPPSLADRALAWGSLLSLRGRVCKDACYFEEPGEGGCMGACGCPKS